MRPLLLLIPLLFASCDNERLHPTWTTNEQRPPRPDDAPVPLLPAAPASGYHELGFYDRAINVGDGKAINDVLEDMRAMARRSGADAIYLEQQHGARKTVIVTHFLVADPN